MTNQQYPTSQTNKSNIAAALFAILLPYLGIHGFYIGNTALGLTVLLTSIGCVILTIISFGILGFVTIPILGVIHVVSIIQGILYLIAGEQEFNRKYVDGKQWF